MLDSIQRPYSFQGSPNDLFKQFINTHNSQVEDTKKFVIRNVNVPDSNNYINRENSNYSNTWEAINDKLIKLNGGHIKTGALQNGQRYIDYRSEYTHLNTQIIQFGENLLDITQYVKAEDIKTAIIPLGKDKLTIESVNNGKDFIYDETAVALFGWIWDTVEFSDVTAAQNLLTKGQNHLSSVINESITIDLSAVDLHNLNCDIERFKVGDWVRVISIPHKLDRHFLVSKLTLNLDNPKSSKLTLGETFNTLTQKQLDNNKELKDTVYNISYNVNKEIKKDVASLKNDVTTINTVIVEIPAEYVKTEIFNNYKTEVNQKLGRVYTVKGSVANYVALGNLQNNHIGDVYNVLSSRCELCLHRRWLGQAIRNNRFRCIFNNSRCRK